MDGVRALLPLALLALVGAVSGCATSGALHQAARRGDRAEVEALIAQGQNPGLASSNGETPLHEAAEKGHAEVVGDLIAAGAPLDARNEDGETPLFLAVDEKEVETTRVLLAAGANPDLADKKRTTPLMLAADEGRVELVRLLLEAGADVDARDEDRETALVMAVDQHHVEIVRMLLAKRADTESIRTDGRTALYHAVEQRDFALAQALLESGANPDQATRDGAKPLTRAIENRDAAIVEMLLERGADPNTRSTSREPALVMATRLRDAETVKLLIDAGARVDVRGSDGRTPLVMAVQGRDVAVTRVLLDGHADPNGLDQNGRTPLYAAVSSRDYEAMEMLLAHGADPEAANQNGARPLVAAIANQDETAVDLLIAAGAEPASAAEVLSDPSAFVARYGYRALVGAALANASETARQALNPAAAVEPPRRGDGSPGADSPPAPPPLPGDPAEDPWRTEDEAGTAPLEQASVEPRPSSSSPRSARSAPRASPYYSKRVAVVVGIDRYRSWPALEGARRDAERVASTFEQMGFDRVIELYDEEATRRGILTALGTDLADYTDERSLAVIYFAGHGETELLPSGDRRGYVVPVDADPDQVFATAISMDTLRSISLRLPARQVYYAMDSCYSGLGFTRGISIPRRSDEDFIQKITSRRAVQMITAGADGEQAVEQGGQGVFTRYFLEALSGEADFDDDGWVTASEIGTYVRPHVTNATRSRQTPRYGTLEGSGEIAFSIRSEPEAR